MPQTGGPRKVPEHSTDLARARYRRTVTTDPSLPIP